MPSLLVGAATPEQAVPAALRAQSNQLRFSCRTPASAYDQERIRVVLTIVLAEVGLERGLAVAKQVVHGRHPRARSPAPT